VPRQLQPAEHWWFICLQLACAAVGAVLTAVIAAEPSVGDNLGAGIAGMGTATILVGVILSVVSRFSDDPERRRQIDGAPFGTLGLGALLIAWPSVCLVSGC